jgi:protein-tyrosine phosphatase
MAAGLLSHRLAALHSDISVRSAGLLGEGVPATGHAISVLFDRGIDISGHRSRHLSAEMVVDADLVLGMARHHVREAVLLDTSALTRAFTLRELVRRADAAAPRAAGEPVASWLRRLDPARRPSDLAGESAVDDIPDPIGRPRRTYEGVATELGRLIAALVPHLVRESDRGVA